MVKVHWVTDYSGAIGNSLGYATHNDRMKEALAATGVEFDDSAPVAVHVCPPNHFQPIGKRSIVSCAWEYPELPAKFGVLRDAACVMPTATFLLDPFRKLLPGVRVEHLPLGVDCETFTLAKRGLHFSKDRPFRFLFLNAPNGRKGAIHLSEAWRAFETRTDVELYCKTTVSPGSGVPVEVQKIGNVTFDTRKLPLSELVNLYHSADCKVDPSLGEGFGLSLAESMATGLPVIYTAAHAFLDLAPVEMKLGYPIKWSPKRQWLGPHGSTPGDFEPSDSDNFDTLRSWVTSANPNVDHIAAQMAAVLRNPREAFDRGRRAAGRIRKHFTWSAAGQRLRKVVDDLYRELSSGTEARRVDGTATAR
jgi:glycosyltransferase involved in cell wall biosynthesis